VEVGGAGLLLGAPGTFGKTTLSGAFHNAGHRLLSDDIAACDVRGDPTVLPVRRCCGSGGTFSIVSTSAPAVWRSRPSSGSLRAAKKDDGA